MIDNDIEDLQRVLQEEVESAINGSSSDAFTAKREKALAYYHGDAFGNEQEGRSQVVVTEVADSVDFALASLMRVYTGQDSVTFSPQSADAVQAAEQASDYCKYIWESSVGFRGLHDMVKDGLLYGLAGAKVSWVTREKYEEEAHEDLSELQLAALLSDDTVEVLEQKICVEAEIETPEELELQIDPMTGMPMPPPPPPPPSFDVTISRRIKDSGIEIVHIPPENVLISDDASSVDDARLVAHRSNVTKSELVQLGYSIDEIDEAAASARAESTEKRARSRDLKSSLNRDSPDDAQELLEYVEGYLLYDMDGDGIAELIKVCALGPSCEILHHEIVDHCPIVLGTVMTMPHRAIGRSMSELLFDVQEIKSQILRQHLDNLYAQNNARTIAVEGQVNLDDLLTATPGGVVRVRSPGAVAPLSVAPLQTSAFQLLEYVDGIKEQRTGLSKASQGMALEKLQSTAAIGINATLSMAQSKMELMARVFAETTIKPIYQIMYRLLRQHQDKPRMARLRGSQFVEVDPSRWPENFTLAVNVGMGGAANIQERLQFLTQVASKQEMVLTTMGQSNPIVTLGQYAETLRRILLLAGIEDTTSLVTGPGQVMQTMQQQAQQQAQAGPQMSPEAQLAAQKAQAEIQVAQQKAQASIELEQLKAQAAHERAVQAQAQTLELKRQEMEAELEMKRQELAMEAQLEAMRVQNDLPGANANIPMS
jgi:hypothetical protein